MSLLCPLNFKMRANRWKKSLISAKFYEKTENIYSIMTKSGIKPMRIIWETIASARLCFLLIVLLVSYKFTNLHYFIISSSNLSFCLNLPTTLLRVVHFLSFFPCYILLLIPYFPLPLEGSVDRNKSFFSAVLLFAYLYLIITCGNTLFSSFHCICPPCLDHILDFCLMHDTERRPSRFLHPLERWCFRIIPEYFLKYPRSFFAEKISVSKIILIFFLRKIAFLQSYPRKIR